jgi:hypothetical protein
MHRQRNHLAVPAADLNVVLNFHRRNRLIAARATSAVAGATKDSIPNI